MVIEAYQQAIQQVIPQEFLDQARQIVAQQRPEGISSEFSPTNHLILVVDDTPSWTKIMRLHIERAGHEAITCETAEDALELMQEYHFAYVLTDSLNGGCAQIFDMAKTYGIPYTLVTASAERMNSTTAQGISCVFKDGLQLGPEMKRIMSSLPEE